MITPISQKQIIIAAERWQFVGDVSRDGDHIVITNAKNIRRWGTTGGLGQLAANGPQSDTILDDYGTVRIHVLAVIAAIDCDEAAWSKSKKRRAK